MPPLSRISRKVHTSRREFTHHLRSKKLFFVFHAGVRYLAECPAGLNAQTVQSAENDPSDIRFRVLSFTTSEQQLTSDHRTTPQNPGSPKSSSAFRWPTGGPSVAQRSSMLSIGREATQISPNIAFWGIQLGRPPFFGKVPSATFLLQR